MSEGQQDPHADEAGIVVAKRRPPETRALVWLVSVVVVGLAINVASTLLVNEAGWYTVIPPVLLALVLAAVLPREAILARQHYGGTRAGLILGVACLFIYVAASVWATSQDWSLIPLLFSTGSLWLSAALLLRAPLNLTLVALLMGVAGLLGGVASMLVGVALLVDGRLLLGVASLLGGMALLLVGVAFLVSKLELWVAAASIVLGLLMVGVALLMFGVENLVGGRSWWGVAFLLLGVAVSVVEVAMLVNERRTVVWGGVLLLLGVAFLLLGVVIMVGGREMWGVALLVGGRLLWGVVFLLLGGAVLLWGGLHLAVGVGPDGRRAHSDALDPRYPHANFSGRG